MKSLKIRFRRFLLEKLSFYFKLIKTFLEFISLLINSFAMGDLKY
uniref:Uncharacterized 5.4 kDa protein in trnK-psbC intergenic region n=1 Tax=Trieres chinensis TaxID=1514140 RepID=YCX9_TRICV|nr:ORF44 [Trieres chinensis]P49835.1 RecName: Full=Uncharacterized 5.4 kDa protein in trnK-psbC intergenic region; AltName: Full=ORF44 [Trieres chinensis]CAA91719.1 ORF44 [Trieres chinensis]